MKLKLWKNPPLKPYTFAIRTSQRSKPKIANVYGLPTLTRKRKNIITFDQTCQDNLKIDKMEKIGSIIRTEREKRKLLLRQASALLEIDQAVLSKIEKMIEDYKELKLFIQDSVYNEVDYKNGYNKIENELELIDKMIKEIGQSNFNWNFKEFDTYKVNLTLYGPGGSYDPDEGSLLIFTTTKGQFKNYDNPANTIIHEITHIGIEEAIVNKYHVTHSLKERIVDTFVFLNFNQYLPDYQIQDMGKYRIDQYLKTKTDLKKLDDFVEIIRNEN